MSNYKYIKTPTSISFNEIQENRKTELYQLLPDFNHLINNLK